MKMKVKDAASSHVALQQFGNTKFPMQITLHLAQNLRVLGEVAELFGKQRNELVVKYGTLDAETGVSTVIPKNQIKFAAEVEALLDEEVELSLRTVSLADLGKKTEMEPNTMVPLDWMITLEGQKPTPIGKRKAN